MTKKRFIAGAVCSFCHTMDTVRTSCDDNGTTYLECVECGFSDTIERADQSNEDTTKVSIAKEKTTGDEHVDIIHLVVDESSDRH